METHEHPERLPELARPERELLTTSRRCRGSLVPQWFVHVAEQRFGLAIPERRMAQFEKAITEACTAAGEVSLERYFSLLESAPLDSPAVAQFVARFTIKESYFFRDEELFTLLRERVLPSLIGRRPPRTPLSVWSAGCSNGEEAYTLGILLEEVVGTSAWLRSSVVGTDLDALAISRARSGAFSEWSMRSLAPRARARYFGAERERHVVRPNFARHVRFEPHNLVDERASPPSPGRFDLILCRNVAIYLTDDAVRALYAKLASALSEDGLLVIAGSDPKPSGALPLREIVIRHGERSLVAYGLTSAASLWHGSEPSVPATPVSGPGRERPTQPAAPSSRAGDLQGGTLRLLPRVISGDDADEGLRVAMETTKVSPLSAASQFALALVHLERGDDQAAEAAFRRTLYLEPGHAHAHYRLGLLCAGRGDPTGARRAFFRALQVVGHVAPEPGGADLAAAIGLELATLRVSR